MAYRGLFGNESKFWVGRINKTFRSRNTKFETSKRFNTSLARKPDDEYELETNCQLINPIKVNSNHEIDSNLMPIPVSQHNVKLPLKIILKLSQPKLLTKLSSKIDKFFQHDLCPSNNQIRKILFIASLDVNQLKEIRLDKGTALLPLIKLVPKCRIFFLHDIKKLEVTGTSSQPLLKFLIEYQPLVIVEGIQDNEMVDIFEHELDDEDDIVHSYKGVTQSDPIRQLYTFLSLDSNTLSQKYGLINYFLTLAIFRKDELLLNNLYMALMLSLRSVKDKSFIQAMCKLVLGVVDINLGFSINLMVRIIVNFNSDHEDKRLKETFKQLLKFLISSGSSKNRITNKLDYAVQFYKMITNPAIQPRVTKFIINNAVEVQDLYKAIIQHTCLSPTNINQLSERIIENLNLLVGLNQSFGWPKPSKSNFQFVITTFFKHSLADNLNSDLLISGGVELFKLGDQHYPSDPQLVNVFLFNLIQVQQLNTASIHFFQYTKIANLDMVKTMLFGSKNNFCHYDNVIGYLEVMDNNNLNWDLKTLTLAIQVLERLNKPTKAIQLLEKVGKTNPRLFHSSDQLEKDKLISVLFRLIKNSNHDPAKLSGMMAFAIDSKFLQPSIDQMPNQHILTSKLSLALGLRDWTMCKDLIQQLLTINALDLDEYAYTTLIKVLIDCPIKLDLQLTTTEIDDNQLKHFTSTQTIPNQEALIYLYHIVMKRSHKNHDKVLIQLLNRVKPYI